MKEIEPEIGMTENLGTYKVEEIAEILSIGRNAAYKLAKSGKFKVVFIGRSIRISQKSFNNWLSKE